MYIDVDRARQPTDRQSQQAEKGAECGTLFTVGFKIYRTVTPILPCQGWCLAERTGTLCMSLYIYVDSTSTHKFQLLHRTISIMTHHSLSLCTCAQVQILYHDSHTTQPDYLYRGLDLTLDTETNTDHLVYLASSPLTSPPLG